MDWAVVISLAVGVAGLQIQLTTKVSELNGRLVRLEQQTTELVNLQHSQMDMLQRISYLEALAQKRRENNNASTG
jgi:hypothetical protein